MGLVQDVHTAVDRYEKDLGATIHAVAELTTTIADLAERIAPGGPLGTSADADLVRARARLAVARQRLVVAAEAAEASGGEARAYADRAFPG